MLINHITIKELVQAYFEKNVLPERGTVEACIDYMEAFVPRDPAGRQEHGEILRGLNVVFRATIRADETATSLTDLEIKNLRSVLHRKIIFLGNADAPNQIRAMTDLLDSFGVFILDNVKDSDLPRLNAGVDDILATLPR